MAPIIQGCNYLKNSDDYSYISLYIVLTTSMHRFIMKKPSFRLSLLLTTSLLLFGCDQDTDATSGQSSSDDTVGFYTPQMMGTPPVTVSGSFLANVAQNRSDWESASDYFGCQNFELCPHRNGHSTSYHGFANGVRTL